mmetsp:Transcript_28830/g.92995  ORF Transcript_28830/g.92995 Transcript_28830/m.92995 type:complete len:528 (-) Transcript_28830:140-1723(-)
MPPASKVDDAAASSCKVLLEVLNARFGGTDVIPEQRVMDALENNNMDHDKAFSELEEELTRCTWTTTTRSKKKSDKSPSKDEKSPKGRGQRNKDDKHGDKKRNFAKDKSKSPSGQDRNAHSDRSSTFAQSPDSGYRSKKSPGPEQVRSQELEASSQGGMASTPSPVRSAETNNASPPLPSRTTPAWSNAAESKSLFAPKPISPASTSQKSENGKNDADGSANAASMDTLDPASANSDQRALEPQQSAKSSQNTQSENLLEVEVNRKEENQNANILPNTSSSFAEEHTLGKNDTNPAQINPAHQDLNQNIAHDQFQKMYPMGMMSSAMGVQSSANIPADSGVPMYGMGASGMFSNQSRLPQVNGQSRMDSYGVNRDGQSQMSMKQNAGAASVQQQMMQQATMMNWQANMMNWNMAPTQMYGGQPYPQQNAFSGQKGYSNLNKKQTFTGNMPNAPHMMHPDMNNYRDMMKMASAAGAYQNGSGAFSYMPANASMYGMDLMGAYGMQGFSNVNGMNGMHDSMMQPAVDVK